MMTEMNSQIEMNTNIKKERRIAFRHITSPVGGGKRGISVVSDIILNMIICKDQDI